jgi:hypothetical protein
VHRFAVTAAAVVATATFGACSDDGVERNAEGRVTSAGEMSVFDLVPGDCVVPPDEVQAQLEQVRVVPCDDPHTQEAYAVIAYDKSDAYPGDRELKTFADGACVSPFEDYVDVAYSDSSLYFTYLLPSARSWNDGDDRSVVCLVTTTGDELTDTVKGSRL